jgi:hypothetical protein
MLTEAAKPSQRQFYRDFLMARQIIDPKDYGIDMDKANFVDELASDFGEIYHGQWSVDELLLHPREALNFCDLVRRKHGWFDLPDDIMLRTLMTRRKNPN